MIAITPKLTKALWVALLLTVSLNMQAIAADNSIHTSNPDQAAQQDEEKRNGNSSTGGGNSNPFAATFGNISGLFNPSMFTGAASGLASTAASGLTAGSVQGRTSLNSMADQYLQQYPEAKFLRDSDIRDANGNAIPGLVNPALIPGAGPFGTMFPPTPAANLAFKTPSRLAEGMITAGLTQIGGFSGQQPSDYQHYVGQVVAGDFMARSLQYPTNAANQARAQAIGSSQAMSNAMGDMAKSQAASAIGYCSSYLKNFTADESNRWNKIRNGLFVPIAILLLLPGAVLTQVRAMAVAGNPVLTDATRGDVNPFEGLLRSVVAIFLIPATYLVVNYGIDFSNSVVDSIAGTYQSIMGSNMYQDALGTEVNAFPVRTPKQNQNAGMPGEWPQGDASRPRGFEQNFIENVDPATGQAIPGKTDEAMPAAAVAARQLSFGANAGLTAAWNILCAFQMAYLGYLFFVGPIAAALWVWPMNNFRAAFPNWIEGVITLCFWSLFWNTAILLMACFKGSQESTTMITTALNFLATSSVKYAFDFASLVKAAGQEAGSKAMSGDKGGGAGAKGSQGKSGSAAANGADTSENAGAGANQPIGPMPGTMPANGVVSPVNYSSPAPSLAAPVPDNGLTPEIPAPQVTTATNAALFTSPSLPPLAIAPNSINSENVSLGGDYTVSRTTDAQGNPVDVLLGANGEQIGTLPNENDPAPIATMNYLGQEIDVERVNTPEGTQYHLTNAAAGQNFTATLPADVAGTDTTMGGTLSGTGNTTEDSIALRASSGTLLLEDGGNTVLIPSSNQNGYDSYTIPQGADSGNFTLTDGTNRHLTIQNQNGNRVVSLQTPDGQAESFTVRQTSDNAYNISHQVNNQPAGSSFVSTDGQSTYYARYDFAGQLTDMDQITGNQINSTLYGDNSTVLGSVNTTYAGNGNSESLYYQPDGTLTASATHAFKPEGGYVDTVKNGQGVVVSVQEAGPGQASNETYARASNYAPVSQYESTTQTTQSSPALDQQYSVESQGHTAASTTQNYTEYAAPDAAPSTTTSVVAQNTAAILQRDAYSPTDYQSVSSPLPARNITNANNSNNNVVQNQNTSNRRSFRTISDILAATTPAASTSPAVEQTRSTTPTPAIPQSLYRNNESIESTQTQYSNTVPEILARFKNSANVNSVLHRNQNTEITQKLSPSEMSTANGATNYQVLNNLLSHGQIQQARLILPIIQQGLAAQQRSENSQQAVNAYVQLLRHYRLNEEAQFIQNSIAPQAVI